jgi:hypothetical protein
MTIEKITTIYALSEPGTMNIRYVGKSIVPQRRYLSHLSRARTTTSNSHVHTWIRSLLNKNTKPDFIILEEVPSHESWQQAEIKWIKHYRDLGYDLTNATPGGDSGGITRGRLGKKNSPEHIEKTRLGRIGKKVRRNPESNIKRAEGVRRYCSLIAKKVYQYDINGLFVREWNSTTEAALHIFGSKTNSSNILKACKTENSTSSGYQWKFTYSDKIQPYHKKEQYNKNIPMSEEQKILISNKKKGIPWSSKRRLAQKIKTKKEYI